MKISNRYLIVVVAIFLIHSSQFLFALSCSGKLSCGTGCTLTPDATASVNGTCSNDANAKCIVPGYSCTGTGCAAPTVTQDASNSCLRCTGTPSFTGGGADCSCQGQYNCPCPWSNSSSGTQGGKTNFTGVDTTSGCTMPPAVAAGVKCYKKVGTVWTLMSPPPTAGQLTITFTPRNPLPCSYTGTCPTGCIVKGSPVTAHCANGGVCPKANQIGGIGQPGYPGAKCSQ